MSSSLDSLVNNLAHGGNYHFFGFEEYNENQYKLLTKGSIHMNTLPIGISLKKRSSLQGKLSIVNSI